MFLAGAVGVCRPALAQQPATVQAAASGQDRLAVRSVVSLVRNTDEAVSTAGTPKYVGAGSCSAVACHGGIAPRSVTKVLQNEYSTWVAEDRHARAYTVLSQPLAVNMARVLGIGAADKAQRCLVCHAVSVPPARRAREFDLADGVSCESCHGPASQWLGPHIQAGAKHAGMVRLGLVDNKNLEVRAARCLQCHLGDTAVAGMTVDHEMIAAGHPDLTFELDSYTAIEPPHWIEKAADQKQALDDPLFGVRAWAVGQSVQLEASLRRLEHRARDTPAPWPEFSEMDCFSCHHSLTGAYPASWRQKEEPSGMHDGAQHENERRSEDTERARVGEPPYNEARFVVFRHLASELDAPATAALERDLRTVAALVAGTSSDRTAVATAAGRAAGEAAALSARIQSATYDQARTRRLLEAISSDARPISLAGERSAEQAAMTLDSLYIAEARAGSKNDATRAALDAMFKQLSNPSAYNAPQFEAAMRKVKDTLR